MEKLTNIKEEGLSQTEAREDLAQLQQLCVLYLGKKGPIQEAMEPMKDLPKEERPAFGQLVNEVKTLFTNMIEERRAVSEVAEMEKRIAEERIDITLSGQKPNPGNAHPLMVVQQKMEDLFIGLGYMVGEGPEAEMDFYNFECANISKDHPVRDMQDTFYINVEELLCTHTITIQTRQLEKFAQEGRELIKVVCPGKVYRRDNDDATHPHQFMQCEGLVVGEHITLSDLKGTLQFLAQKMFGEEHVIRFRPSYFQFTEPSVEVDASCHVCGGKGCPVYKGTGWIEILGAGMVHPNVFSVTRYDVEKLSGFVFGIGIERVAMLKYGITDIRDFYTNDIRFLETFNRFEQEDADMRISKEWLNQYTDLSDMSIEEIAGKMTSAGPEVEGIERMSQESNPIIGKAVSCEDHPGSDHLHVRQVDPRDKIEQIVCGAPNAVAGQKVIAARVGVKLLGGDIKAGVIRGQESNEMTCSLLELGVDPHQPSEESKNGIEVPDEDASVGNENPLGYLALDDEILDVGLTPNRSGCMAVWSMTLEAGVILHKEVNIPYVEGASNVGEASRLIVRSEIEKCPLLLGRVINFVTIKPSPKWMQELLMAVGTKSINNVVDTSSIVTLETGRPLRFYDPDAVPAQEITVKDQQQFDYTTLDGESYHIEEDDIAITTEGKLIGITDIMGGDGSKIEEMIKGITIETAIFHHISTRNTSRCLNLGTDASVRYQKGIEPMATFKTVDRAVQLLIEYADVSGLEKIKRYGSNGYTSSEFDMNLDRINTLFGANFQQEEVMKVLDNLHLEPSVNNSDIHVKISSHQMDLAIEADIAEEITRILGYERLSNTIPKMSPTAGTLSRRQQLCRKYRNMPSDLGYNEAVTYSLVGRKEIEGAVMPHKDIAELAAPMSEDHKYVRDPILPSLLECVVYNQTRSIKDIALSEISNVYRSGHVEECLTVATSDALQGNRWQKFRMEVDFYIAKGLVEALLGSIGCQGSRVVSKENHIDIIYFHPYRSAEVYFGRELLGLVGQTYPKMTQTYDITETLALEINLEILLKSKPGKMKFTEVSKYPSISRGLTFIVKEDVKTVDIISSIKKNGKLEKENITQNVEVFDVYTGEHVEKGNKSVVLSIAFQPAQRMLEDADINETHNGIPETPEKDLHVQP